MTPIIVKANRPPIVIAPAQGKQGPPGGVPLVRMVRSTPLAVTSTPAPVTLDLPPVENAPDWDVSALGVVAPENGNYRATVASNWSGATATDQLTLTIERSTSGTVVALDDAATTASPLKITSRVVSAVAGETIGLSASASVAVSLDSVELTVEQMPVTGITPGGGGGGAVDAVNGQTGSVVLDAADVGAEPEGTTATAISAHEADATPHPAIATALAEKVALADLQVVHLTPAGSGSLDTTLQARLDDIAAAGGGELVIPPGSYTMTVGVTYDATNGPLVVKAKGVKVDYSGTGFLCTVLSSSSVANFGGVVIEGGEWNVTSAADGVFRSQDLQGTEFLGCSIGMDSGIGIEIRNEVRWSENTKIARCAFSGNEAVVFTPQSISGGVGGSESFARTRIENCWVGGGAAGVSKFHIRGGVYGSSFHNIGGNIPSGSGIYLLSGTGSTPPTTGHPAFFFGTVISGSQDFETVDGGGGGGYLFHDDGANNSSILLDANVHLININFNHATQPASFSVRREYNLMEIADRTTDPITPDSGWTKLYSKNGLLFQRDDAGVVTQLTGGGGGAVDSVNGETGPVTLDAIDIPQSNPLIPGAPADTQSALNSLLVVGTEKTTVMVHDETTGWPARPIGNAAWAGPGTAGQPPDAADGELVILDDGSPPLRVLGAADPVPPGTPTGTVILRTA